MTRCDAVCERVWPPFLTPQVLPAARDPLLRADLIGLIQRPDGTRQVTYKGQPLYLYLLDQTATESLPDAGAEALGQAVQDEWGRWYLVTPSGEKLERLRHPPGSP